MPIDLDRPGLLDELTRDARRAWDSTRSGPADPRGRAAMLRSLARGAATLPPAQVQAVVAPLEAWIRAQSDAALATFVTGDRDGDTGAFFDLLQAVAQRGEGYLPEPTAAFQEFVSDLYDGFLSAEDRRGVYASPDSPLPPLVRWGNPADGPYTWPVELLARFGVHAGLINLPPAYARGGLAAWASLGHETCGHDVLNGYPGLLPELRRAVARALEAAGTPDAFTEHWMRGFEEAASDVMGVLNLGPVAALADVAFYRGCYRDGRMGMVEDPTDEHPIDLLRVDLVASVVRGLRFAGADEWAGAVEREARRDALGRALVIGGHDVALSDGRASAAVFARAMTGTRLEALDQIALGEIQNWRDSDQAIAESLQRRLLAAGADRVRVRPGEYAAHVLAGALMAAMDRPRALRRLFGRFTATLAWMNARNPAWRPDAVVRHRGDAARHFLRRRTPERSARG